MIKRALHVKMSNFFFQIGNKIKFKWWSDQSKIKVAVLFLTELSLVAVK